MMGGGRWHPESHSPLTVAMLEPALLILLKEHSSHGYNLIGDLEAIGLGTIHPSVIYRTLRDLEALEWVQSDWESGLTQGPPRRIYHLTPQGQEALESWKRELEKMQGMIAQLLERTGQ